MKFCLLALSVLVFFSCSPRDIDKNTNKQATPKVVNIYPTADTLPENLLRLYVQFSHSMKAINNLENIKLFNHEGEEIKGAIFNNVYELWDVEQKQLTLILDPSRVKTGLVAHNTLGRALQPNNHYKLVIEKAEDIYGNQLDVPYVKDMHIVNEDKEIPNTKSWNIEIPNPNTMSPLKIDFSQTLDQQSIRNSIRVIKTYGQGVPGTIEISKNESQWKFHPFEKWTSGIYIIQINSRLEDPFGNNLNGLFDHKVGDLKSPFEGKIAEITIVVE